MLLRFFVGGGDISEGDLDRARIVQGCFFWADWEFRVVLLQGL